MVSIRIRAISEGVIHLKSFFSSFEAVENSYKVGECSYSNIEFVVLTFQKKFVALLTLLYWPFGAGWLASLSSVSGSEESGFFADYYYLYTQLSKYGSQYFLSFVPFIPFLIPCFLVKKTKNGKNQLSCLFIFLHKNLHFAGKWQLTFSLPCQSDQKMKNGINIKVTCFFCTFGIFFFYYFWHNFFYKISTTQLTAHSMLSSWDCPNFLFLAKWFQPSLLNLK